MKRTRKHPGIGFTLLEALLASGVLAMAVAAILMPFTAGAHNEQNDARATLAVALAQEMMEEVLSQPFKVDKQGEVLGPEPGENKRTKFDTIDDYHGYTELDGEIVSLDERTVSEPAVVGLSRHVAVSYVYVAGQDTGGPPTFLRVTVEVKYRNQPLVTLSRLVYDVSDQ